MFDCPEQSQTSPASTSLSSMVLPCVWTLSVCGPPGPMASKVTHHSPVWPAVAVFAWPSSVTVTFSPLSAQPHTGMGRWDWRTM